MTELQKALDWQLAKVTINDDGTANTLTRIGVFFGVLGQLIDGRAFPARATVDAFIESAVLFLYEKEILWDWLTRWQDIARGEKRRKKEPPEKPDNILDKIVLFDSTTSENLAKWHGVRGVYHNIEKMRWADDILSSEEKALGRPLTREEKIAVLGRAKEYLAPALDGGGDILVISDRWGDFSISTTLPIFDDRSNEEIRRRLEDRLKYPELFDDPETIAKINAELSKIILYQTAAKFYRLSAVYYWNMQTERIKIPKSEALDYFGRDPGDKSAYAEIKGAGWVLYNASVIIKGDRFKGAQRFWSSFHEDQKNYYIGFVPDTWPATRELVESYGKDRTAESLDILRQRRYFPFPPRIDAAGLSSYGDFYAGFLLRETGNDKVKDVPDGQKVIAFTGARHCEGANIQDSNNNRKVKAMIATWREIMNKTNIITQIEPGLRTIEGMTPGRFFKTVIRVYARIDADEINRYLKERQQRK